MGVIAATGGELGAAVDRHVTHVDTDVFVVPRQAVLHQLMEHAGLDPLGAAGAQGGVRHLGVADRGEDVLCGLPRASGHEADQQSHETDSVRDPFAASAVAVLGRGWEPVLEHSGEQIQHLGLERAHHGR